MGDMEDFRDHPLRILEKLVWYLGVIRLYTADNPENTKQKKDWECEAPHIPILFYVTAILFSSFPGVNNNSLCPSVQHPPDLAYKMAQRYNLATVISAIHQITFTTIMSRLNPHLISECPLHYTHMKIVDVHNKHGQVKKRLNCITVVSCTITVSLSHLKINPNPNPLTQRFEPACLESKNCIFMSFNQEHSLTLILSPYLLYIVNMIRCTNNYTKLGTR